MTHAPGGGLPIGRPLRGPPAVSGGIGQRLEFRSRLGDPATRLPLPGTVVSSAATASSPQTLSSAYVTLESSAQHQHDHLEVQRIPPPYECRQPFSPAPSSDYGGKVKASPSGGCLFPLELDDAVIGGPCSIEGRHRSALDEVTLNLLSLVEKILQPVDRFSAGLSAAATELRDSCKPCLRLGLAADPSTLANLLRGRRYSVVLRSTRVADSRLQHAFLYVPHDASEFGPPRFVVDPNFRELFSVAAVSSHPRFSAILQSLPSCFVGTQTQLQQMVALLCDQLLQAFTDLDVAIPPWRELSSYMSRWVGKPE